MDAMTKDDFQCGLNDWSRLLEAAQAQRNSLCVAVASEAMVRGLSIPKFEAQTGLKHSSIMMMIFGVPGFATLFDGAIEPLAKFLRWPTIVVKAMIGQVRVEDFYTRSELDEQAESMAIRLDAPTLREVPKNVAVFAGVLACADGGRRRALRDVCVDGPPHWH